MVIPWVGFPLSKVLDQVEPMSSATYVAFETVLPISLVGSHGYSSSTWGFLVVVNPLLVTFFQLRLTERLRPVPAAEARRVLEEVALGEPEARLTRRARAALSRTGSVPGGKTGPRR